MSDELESAVEAERLEALRRYDVLDTPAEENFDELARLASQICGTTMALISFMDSERVWNKSRIGLDVAQLPVEQTLCATAIKHSDVTVIQDASADPRYAQCGLVAEGKVRFFAGMPLRVESAGEPVAIGMLCVLDSAPRTLAEHQVQALRTLARQVVAQLELRRNFRELHQKHSELEIALQHSESFYHSLVETIPQNIFRKDRLGRFTFANSKFCESVNRPLSEILGKTDFDLFPPELAAKYQQDDRRVLEHKAAFKTTEQHRDKDGSLLYVQVIKSPLCDPSGNVAGVQGIFWDETDRFKAEAALAYERDLLRAMLDNIPDSIYFKDRRSKFITISRSLAIRLGLDKPEDAVGKSDADFFGPEHSRQAFEDEQRIIRTGQPLVAKPERELWQDGTERWVLTTKVPLKHHGGEIIGTFGISKDITELKRTEAELARTRDAALESARLKSEFLANMSHEIRTPLNAVIGMTGLLLDTKLSEEQRDFAETIRNSADALLNIINDILDFSKIEAGKMAIETIEFEVSEVVEGTVELLAEQAQTKGLELASWVHEDVPRHLRGDPGRLRQVLTNLVGNAVKFTPKGEVLVDVAPVREWDKTVALKFSVKDTGIGIPEDAQGRLFQAFVQADGSTTRRYGGTGLGLAISRQLVELMHGEMGFESQPGKGSTFWFTIPFEKQGDQRQQRGMASTLESVRILVVDDNQTNRDIVHHQVISWKMRNGSAESGPRALEMLQEAAASGDPYHIAILDMQMPEMDGLTLARQIKNDPAIKDTQLVMLTSLGHLPEERLWRECGIAAYLIKPVKEHRLYDTLVSVMRGAERITRRKQLVPDHLPEWEALKRTVRILIAEDNVVNQKVALRQLQKLGYSADAVANGLEAIQALNQIPYHMVLMDCQMPELDGLEATRLIRSQEAKERRKHRVHVIAMTANALAGDREECLNAGMDDYISKPVRLAELEAALNKGLEALNSENESQWLDQQMIAGMRELAEPGEPDPLTELVGLFEEDTPHRLKEIADSFAAGNLEALERSAHALKGSASNLGGIKLAHTCQEIMTAARSGTPPSPEVVEALPGEYQKTLQFLRKACQS